jgi:hypothetical protein
MTIVISCLILYLYSTLPQSQIIRRFDIYRFIPTCQRWSSFNMYLDIIYGHVRLMVSTAAADADLL